MIRIINIKAFVLFVKVSYDNYSKYHQLISDDLMREMNIFLNFNSDDELFKYQYKTEREIVKFLGGKYGLGLSSGTAALQFALIALGIGPGDEVITVPNTYIATVLAISNIGAKPVFIDVCEDTGLIDIDMIKDVVTDRTKAIIPVHLFGQMCDMKLLAGVAKKYGLKLVEDAAQAHGSKCGGKGPGLYSDAACFSFFPSKNLSGFGNGGMIISKSKRTIKKVEQLRNPKGDNVDVLKSGRTPAYLDAINMIKIKVGLKYFEKLIVARQKIAKFYDENLDVACVNLTKCDIDTFHTYRNYVLRVDRRSRLIKYLARKGIETKIHYSELIPFTKAYQYLGYSKGDFPVAEKLVDSIVSIPVNPFLHKSDVKYIVDSINGFY